jgi:cytoplasmic tRNA 2-thiolation protein 1
MKTLNERYEYGLSLFLLSIDEGITGYRDDSLEVGTNKFCAALY